MTCLVTSRQAKAIDRKTIGETGILSLVLLERAALKVADCVEHILKVLDHRRRVVAVCGTGNNGGDGIAAARILHSRGYDVTVVLVGEAKKRSKDCEIQLHIANNLAVPVMDFADIEMYDVVIDAIFGIGIDRPVIGSFAAWIEAINRAGKKGSKIVSVDIPSGIHTDTGQVLGVAVKADLTVTFGYVKLGMVLYEGADYVGTLCCEDIGFDPNALISFVQDEKEQVTKENALSTKKFTESAFIYQTYSKGEKLNLPKRKNDGHKGSFGRVLVIAGSKNMAGAAAFSAKAAYRTGAGLITVYTAKSNRVILQTMVSEAVLKTWDDELEVFDDAEKKQLKNAMNESQVIVLGPGLGTDRKAEAITEFVLKESQIPLILDADGINVVAKHREWLEYLGKRGIVTPHLKELSRLTGEEIACIKNHLQKVCVDFQARYGVICVAKDARSFVFDGSDTIYVNSSGNNGMGTGGSGDILTGVIAGLIAQGLPIEDAARVGVCVHGRAGDLAASRVGAYSMMATDIIDRLSDVLMETLE